MEKILVINTGGTFNKIYNPVTGALEVDKEGFTVQKKRRYSLFTVPIQWMSLPPILLKRK